MAPGIPGFAKEVSMNSWLTWGYWYMFLLLKELSPPDGLPARIKWSKFVGGCWGYSSIQTIVCLTGLVGMIRESEWLQLSSVLGRAIKQGFLPPLHPSFSDICDRADHRLFQALLHNPDHVLHQLLPPVKNITYELRPRAHDREIPRHFNSLFKKTFMMKMIFLDSY